MYLLIYSYYFSHSSFNNIFPLSEALTVREKKHKKKKSSKGVEDDTSRETLNIDV